jgi:DNA sulfur modification protein DndB
VVNGKATFPAIRAMMGDWVYYVTTVEFQDIATRVSQADEVHKNEKLREWIQRKVTPRATAIARYLVSQPQRFFNALILGIYDGTPEWFPVELKKSRTLGVANVSDWARESIGLLRLSGAEKIFAIDGQHRCEAIKRAIVLDRSLGKEQQCAIFVAHETTRAGIERTRRLFSTLNRYAKPVSKGEIVALDEDDAFAIVTRQLVEEYQALNGERVCYGKQKQLPPGDKAAITSILALAEIAQILWVPANAPKAERDRLTRVRPPQETLDKIYHFQVEFWDAIRKWVPEVSKATDAPPEAGVAGQYRTATGGHLLFRPIGQTAFAQAARVLIDRGQTISSAVATLARLPMSLAAPPWMYVFWDPIKQSILRPKPALTRNLLLHVVGQRPFPSGYDLLQEYRSAVKSELAELPETLKGGK